MRTSVVVGLEIKSGLSLLRFCIKASKLLASSRRLKEFLEESRLRDCSEFEVLRLVFEVTLKVVVRSLDETALEFWQHHFEYFK